MPNSPTKAGWGVVDEGIHRLSKGGFEVIVTFKPPFFYLWKARIRLTIGGMLIHGKGPILSYRGFTQAPFTPIIKVEVDSPSWKLETLEVRNVS